MTRYRFLLACFVFIGACRDRQRETQSDAQPASDARASDAQSSDSSLGGTPDGPASAIAPDASSALCGWTAFLGSDAVRSLPASALADGGAPRSIGFARFATAANKPVKTALVVGEPGACDLLWNHGHYKDPDPSGPFTGVESDTSWTGAIFAGRLHIAVALLDGTGTPRHVAIVETWRDKHTFTNAELTSDRGFDEETGTGRSVSAIERFRAARRSSSIATRAATVRRP